MFISSSALFPSSPFSFAPPSSTFLLTTSPRFSSQRDRQRFLRFLYIDPTCVFSVQEPGCMLLLSSGILCMRSRSLSTAVSYCKVDCPPSLSVTLPCNKTICVSKLLPMHLVRLRFNFAISSRAAPLTWPGCWQAPSVYARNQPRTASPTVCSVDDSG